jgi:hypothetical protein
MVMPDYLYQTIEWGLVRMVLIIFSLVVIRNLRQTKYPDPDQERAWWRHVVAGLDHVRNVLIYSPESTLPLEVYTLNGIYQAGTCLLDDLREYLIPLCRLVLVGHSFGGQILKQACYSPRLSWY